MAATIPQTDATSLVLYQSAGRCAIVTANVDTAIELLDKLSPLRISVLVIDPCCAEPGRQLTEHGTVVVFAPAVQAAGHLGAFRLGTATADHDLTSLLFGDDDGCCDLLLDLLPEPLFDRRVPPFGYFHAGSADALAGALAQLPEMTGEFEKPRYFSYEPSRCAHSRRRLTGCQACLSVCSADAISPAGEGIEVNPYLCQGCGTCSTVCPGGAIGYRWPALSQAVRMTREMRGRADSSPVVLILYRQHEDPAVDHAFERSLPATAMGVAVEEVTAFGLDFWAAQLCNGFRRIVIRMDSPLEPEAPDMQALQHQARLLAEIVRPFGYDDDPVVLVSSADSQTAILAVIEQEQHRNRPAITPAGFEVFNDKRQTFRQCIDYLRQQTGLTPPVVPLSHLPQAPGHTIPFGRVVVDAAACTLCMGCVSVCPAGALLDDPQLPRLRFIESGCLQCGLCEQACPESAITLAPQFNADSASARQTEVLVEEAPFCCIRCNRPFATRRIIDNILAKLEGHWMFSDDSAQRRLKMCEDCRVVDLLEQEASVAPGGTADTSTEGSTTAGGRHSDG